MQPKALQPNHALFHCLKLYTSAYIEHLALLLCLDSSLIIPTKFVLKLIQLLEVTVQQLEAGGIRESVDSLCRDGTDVQYM